jgi:hypothetical protein
MVACNAWVPIPWPAVPVHCISRPLLPPQQVIQAVDTVAAVMDQLASPDPSHMALRSLCEQFLQGVQVGRLALVHESHTCLPHAPRLWGHVCHDQSASCWYA